MRFINNSCLNTGDSSRVARFDNLLADSSGSDARGDSGALRGASEFVAAELSEGGSVSAADGFRVNVEAGSASVQGVSTVRAEVTVEDVQGLRVNNIAVGNGLTEKSEESLVVGAGRREARGGAARLRNAGGSVGVRASVSEASSSARSLNAGGSSRLASVREAVVGAGGNGSGGRDGFLEAGSAARSVDAGSAGGGRVVLVASGAARSLVARAGGRAGVREASGAARGLEAGSTARSVLAGGDLSSGGGASSVAHLRRPVLREKGFPIQYQLTEPTFRNSLSTYGYVGSIADGSNGNEQEDFPWHLCGCFKVLRASADIYS
ncbi:UNVERIFIED_CONTAM: hypothetical protein PYX00_000398 [Menopon gallinae]|uniref:Uncharacterized protein n=1 Tax=Menopon gallinae TaxID=328185 RepID=A0AAW2I8D3_9NEOP